MNRMDKKAKLSFANLYSTYGVFFILVIEFLIFSLASKSFLTLGNILSVGRQMSFTGIAAIGMTLVMLTGGIDISVGSMLAMAGVLCAKLSADVGLPLWIAVVITLLIGALFGLINGAAVTRLHIPALIATLATQTILKGIAYLLTNAVPVKNLSATYKFLGQGYIFGVIPVPLIITVALYVLAWWYLDKTYLGPPCLPVRRQRGGGPPLRHQHQVDHHRHLCVQRRVRGHCRCADGRPPWLRPALRGQRLRDGRHYRHRSGRHQRQRPARARWSMCLWAPVSWACWPTA